MKHRKAVKLALLIGWIASIVLLSGCNRKTDSVTSTESSTQAELENIINQNPAIFTTDQEETEETAAYASVSPNTGIQYVSDYYVDAASATLPVAWFRKKQGAPSRNISINEQGDTATVTITTNWAGKLYVDRSRDGRRNPGTKPIADTGIKKAYFEKIYGIWNLKKVTCVDHNLTNPAKQTVDITQVEAKTNSQSYIINDPGKLMDIATELPTFAPGTEVKVIVTVTNTAQTWNPPAYVYLHHGMPWARNRKIMYDDGTNGDEQAGDGKYTRIYNLDSDSDIYRSVVIDVLDSGCLQNETNDDYNSTAWRIPYKVQ